MQGRRRQGVQKRGSPSPLRLRAPRSSRTRVSVPSRTNRTGACCRRSIPSPSGPAATPPNRSVRCRSPRLSRRPGRPRRSRQPHPPHSSETIQARLATPAELADWDARTVGSRTATSTSRSRGASTGRRMAGQSGTSSSMMASECSWSAASGRWLAAAGRTRRGDPIPEDHALLSAARSAAAAELLANDGVDSFTVDGETPAAAGLGRFLQARGFRPVDEVQTSRHRMDVSLGPEHDPNSDEKTIFGSFGATTRNNIRQAERHGLRVMRLDAGGGRAEDEAYSPGTLEGLEPVGLEDVARSERMLRMFYVMLDATADRRGFALASRGCVPRLVEAGAHGGAHAVPAGRARCRRPCRRRGFLPARPSADLFPRR